MAETGGLVGLEGAVARACRSESDWAAGVAAGVYAGVDFAIAHPEIAELDPTTLESASEFAQQYDWLISWFTASLQIGAPKTKRRPAATDEATVAGVVGIVGDHLRLRRLGRLAALRPELVLILLLPYLGFDEAKRRADRLEPDD